MRKNQSDDSEKKAQKPEHKLQYSSPKHKEDIEKFISDLPKKVRLQIWDAIWDLKKNPRPSGHGFIKQLGFDRIRQGDFRIFYLISDKDKIVYLNRIKRREEKTYRR